MTGQMIRAFTVMTMVTGAVMATNASAQTVDEIVARHYQTKGGQARWQAIQTQKMTATVQTGGIELAMIHYSKRPGLGRQELVAEIPGQGPIAITNIFDGTTAWTINPMTGANSPQQVTGAEAQAMRDQAEFESPLLDYKAKGNSVELIGTETLDANRVHHLKITRKDRTATHVYLDAESGVERRITSEAPNSPIVEMTDYRAVDGIQVPHRMRVILGGQVQAEITVTAIEFNVPMDDKMFTAK